MTNISEIFKNVQEAIEGDKINSLRTIPAHNLVLTHISRSEKQMELQSKILGNLQLSGVDVNQMNIDAQFAEFRNCILEVMCPNCRTKIIEYLRERVGANNF